MFRVQRFHKRKTPVKDTTSVPIIFRSAKPSDMIEIESDFFFYSYINKDNILNLFPDMQDINGWWTEIPKSDYSNTSFYATTNTSNLIIIGEERHKQIAVIAKVEGSNMKGFESLQIAVDPSIFVKNHKYFPTEHIKAKVEGSNMKGFESLQIAVDPSIFVKNHKYFPTEHIKKDTVSEIQLFRITDISANDFGMSYNCTECKIPIGLFNVTRIIH